MRSFLDGERVRGDAERDLLSDLDCSWFLDLYLSREE